jgi:hypothetical protein
LTTARHARRTLWESSSVPTFTEYVPVVAAACRRVPRRAYGSYWNRVLQEWGERRIDEPKP